MEKTAEPRSSAACLLGATRSSLLDTLAHGALHRAMSALSDSAESVYVIDATAGNGHDTCMLARLAEEISKKNKSENAKAGNICIIACDIQEEALKSTAERLQYYGFCAELFLCGHENILDKLPKQHIFAGAVFNLGYLPGKDRKNGFLSTKAETSVIALSRFCGALFPRGCICVHCYTGHEGGLEEFEAVRSFVSSLAPKEWRVLCVSDVNREHNSEYLFLLEKLQRKKGM